MANVDISEIRQEDMDAIQADLLNMVKAYRKNPGKILDKAEDIRVAFQPDENPEEPEPQTLAGAMAENLRRADELDGLRRSALATPEDIEGMDTGSRSFEDARRRAAESPDTQWAEQEMPIAPGTVSINGKSYKYGLCRRPAGWGAELSDDMGDLGRNLEVLCGLVSEDFRLNFGGWQNIKKIVITGSQLIVNDVLYVPVIDPKYGKRLPLGSMGYLEAGCLAPLFDYKYLRKMRSLSIFICDSEDFYITKVADDLRISRNIGVSSLFNVCRSLSSVTLGRKSVTRESLYTQESVGIKRSLNQKKRSMRVVDNIAMGVCSATSSLQALAYAGLHNYTAHRGNKGLARFFAGSALWAGAAVTTWSINQGTSFLREAWGIVRDIVSEAKK